MTHTFRSARSAAAGLLAMTVAAVFAPGTTCAQSVQSLPRSEKGIYAGVSVGVHFEAAEGSKGQGMAGSGLIGYQFNARWAIQGEFGDTGNFECFEVWVSPDRKETVCDGAPIANLIDVVRRFTAGSLRPYVALGLGMGVHVGTGVEIPIGRRFAVVPAVDVNVLPDMLAVRPKVALLVRF